MSELWNKINQEIMSAVRTRNSERRDLLKTLKSECMSEINLGSRYDEPPVNRIIQKIKKIITANEQIIELAKSKNTRNKAERENVIMLEFLPKPISDEELLEHINNMSIDLKTAKSVGQAIGQVMGSLKKSEIPADGSQVSRLVNQILG